MGERREYKVAFSAKELEIIDAHATKMGLNRSDYLRLATLAYAREQKALPASFVESGELAKLREQIEIEKAKKDLEMWRKHGGPVGQAPNLTPRRTDALKKLGVDQP